MPLLRFAEHLGTAGADHGGGGSYSITYGLQGSDWLTPFGADFVVLSGGSGADVYEARAGQAMTVADNATLDTFGDVIVATGIGFSRPTSFAATVDGRHLYAFDTASQQSVVVLDWFQTANQIEFVDCADGLLTFSQVVHGLSIAPGYLGNLSLEQAGFVPAGFSAADVREAISHYHARGKALETVPPPPPPVSTAPSEGRDSITGTSGNDSYAAGGGNDTVSAGAGNDSVNGNQGDDQINGNLGDDHVRGGQGHDNVRGGQNDDEVYGDLGTDTVFGDLGDDVVLGGRDDDLLFGGRGNDSLSGDLGNDTVHGDRGNDTLHGRAGADRFGFAPDGGADEIRDFSFDQGDRILLTGGLQLQAVAASAAGAALVRLSDGTEMTLVGVRPGSVATDWFVML